MKYAQEALTGGRPIPGQSLTTDPSNPAPYEKAPQYTSVHEATRSIFEHFIEPENYTTAMEVLADDVPIMDVVQVFLFGGFQEGKWNPDLMLMLAEPVAYILLALAERAGIDPVIYAGEDEDEAADLAMLGTTFQKERLKNMEEFSKEQIALPEGVLPKEITEQIKTVQPPESLLAKQPEKDTEASEASLLSEPVVEEQV